MKKTCPDCGKAVTVNKDGTLRKHECTAPEAKPQGPRGPVWMVPTPEGLVPEHEVNR